MRAVFGPGRSRPGEPTTPADEAREPERTREPEHTSPGS